MGLNLDSAEAKCKSINLYEKLIERKFELKTKFWISFLPATKRSDMVLSKKQQLLDEKIFKKILRYKEIRKTDFFS